MSQTIDFAALLAQMQRQAGSPAAAAPVGAPATASPIASPVPTPATAPATGLPAATWQNPGTTMGAGTSGTQEFFRPNNSQMMQGQQLYNYLTDNGTATPDRITNRTVKFDGGLTREMLGNTTGFLSNQINNGFGTQYTAMEDLFNKYGSLGGLGGVAQSGNASAVYRPTGQAQTSNGASLPWGSTNPFNATF
jgi:hypothetical protein